MPRLAGQREEFLAEVMLQYRQNRRAGGDTIMTASLQGIAEADFKALAHYFSQIEVMNGRMSACAVLRRPTLAQVARVAERVAAGLRPHGEPVRLLADRDHLTAPLAVSNA